MLESQPHKLSAVSLQMQPEWKIATNLSQNGYDGKDAKRTAAACALQWLYMFLFECTHSENISNVCRVTRHYDRIPNSSWTVWQSFMNLLSMFHEPDDRFHHPPDHFHGSSDLPPSPSRPESISKTFRNIQNPSTDGSDL